MFDFLKRKKKNFAPKVGGWRADPETEKYWTFDKKRFSFKTAATGEVDLRPYSSPRHDQSELGSCVAQSLIKALEIKRILRHGHKAHVDLSVLDLYYGARDLMNPKETHLDDGTYIHLGCDVLRRYGVARAKLWPYDMKNVHIAPPVMATREASLNRIHSHFRLVSKHDELLDEIILNLHAGNPVVFGTQVGTDWFNYKKGVLRVEKNPKGQHAICIVGYVAGSFIIENSWSGTWGENGFARLSPEVLTHPYSKDFWVIVDGSEVWFEGKKK